MKSFFCSLLVLFGCASPVLAHGTPFDVFVQGGKVQISSHAPGNINASEIATLPGFGIGRTTATPGILTGESVKLEFERILMSNGSSLLTSTGSIEIDNPDGDAFRVVSASSSWQSPLHWMDYDGVLGMHKHGIYTVTPGTDATLAPTRAYGIVARASIDGFITSDPFVIVLNKGLTVGELASAQGLFATAVPEPSSLALAGIAAIGLAGFAWKKRRNMAIR